MSRNEIEALVLAAALFVMPLLVAAVRLVRRCYIQRFSDGGGPFLEVIRGKS